MSTGLTFGTIAALYGLTNGYIDQPTYTILVTVVHLQCGRADADRDDLLPAAARV